mgnify:CR=1 FL=1
MSMQPEEVPAEVLIRVKELAKTVPALLDAKGLDTLTVHTVRGEIRIALKSGARPVDKYPLATEVDHDSLPF